MTAENLTGRQFLLAIIAGFVVGVCMVAAAFSMRIITQDNEVTPTPEPVVETVYIEVDDGCEPYYKDIADSITQEDVDAVAQITWLEAGNQSMTGKRAVVEVIFNRVMSDKFPDTVRGVLFQKGQFTTAKNISASKPTQEEYDAIDAVLNESEPILDPDVLFFSTTGFKNRTTYDRIGGHVFCY